MKWNLTNNKIRSELGTCLLIVACKKTLENQLITLDVELDHYCFQISLFMRIILSVLSTLWWLMFMT